MYVCIICIYRYPCEAASSLPSSTSVYIYIYIYIYIYSRPPLAPLTSCVLLYAPVHATLTPPT